MERTGVIFVWIALIAGTLLTCWGLAHMPWPNALPWWGGGAITTYTAFLTICAALVIAGSLLSKRSALLTGSIVGIGIAILAGAIWPLLVTLLFAVASALLGRAILKLLRLRFEGDGWLTSLLVGAGFYGVAVGLIAHFPVSYPGLYGVALALPIMLGWRTLVKEGGELLAQAAQKNVDGVKFNGLDVAIAVVGLVHFVVAFMPELGFDALWMHLFVPAHMAARHQWSFDASTYVWAVIPMLGDWLFTIGYMLAGETASRLINVGFIFILGLLTRNLTLWVCDSALGARWASLIFLSTPLTFGVSSTLFIDSVLAAFAVGGTLAFLKACSAENNQRDQIIIAGILMGFALHAKALTFTELPALALVLIWRYKVWLKSGNAGPLAIGLGLFSILGAVPYLTAWLQTGNPVFPFFNKVFQSPLWHPVNFMDAAHGKGTTWDVLYQIIFYSEKYMDAARPGASGFQWLILFLPTAVLVLLSKQFRWIALFFIGILSSILVFHSTAYLRYIFSFTVILTAAIGATMAFAQKKGGMANKAFSVMGSTVILLNLLFLNAGAFYGDFPLQSIFSEENRRQYISQRIPIRDAVELVNRLNTGRNPVAIFSSPLTAGLFSDALYPDWANFKFQSEISSIQTEQDVAGILFKRGVDFVVLDANWNGVNCCGDGAKKQGFIEKATIGLAKFGSLSVRQINNDYRFKSELLINPDFASTKGWDLAAGVTNDVSAGVILVSVASNASQGVAVSSGRRYLNSVVARCQNEKATGRVQTNWVDAKGKFISADIQTFDCANGWDTHTMEVVAPPGATTAIIYGTGHTEKTIEIKSISFRQ